MENIEIIKKESMNCPLCGHFHEVEMRKSRKESIVKGESVSYDEVYYYCPIGYDGEHEFVNSSLLDDNLLNARNAYRINHGLLTSKEIVEIRDFYKLSQVEMARLMGWGEATISRYESKSIQDETYDTMLRMVREDPNKALEFFDKNIDKFSRSRAQDIRLTILENINTLEEIARDGSLKIQFLENKQMDYSSLSDEDIKILDKVIEKFEGYNAKQIIEYMHQEDAYINTNHGDIIPFSLDFKIKEF